MTRTLAVVDGEHYAPVVRDALAELPYEFVAAYFAGGSEKVVGDDDYGVPVAADFERALAEWNPELVFDLSGEPVLEPAERLRLVSTALALGVAYAGADFRFDPPTLEPFSRPSLAVIGTGKRVGKTAVTGRIARVLSQQRKVVVVAMGRGGPPEPQVIQSPPTVEDLVSLSRAGGHAASDYLETAALAGVPTVGCRRCGSGMAGAVATSSVLAGAEVACGLDPDLVIFDGSGAGVPPIAADARILVAHDVSAGLNLYRVLISDLVLTMNDRVAREVASVSDVPVLSFDLRLKAASPLGGRRTAVFTTGAERVDHLDADVVHCSVNLARRNALRDELARVDADVYLVELKAAAIDVVAEAALERGAEIVLAENEVVADGLDEHIETLAGRMLERVA
jgi:cyclic 2,3-diphosphoglycerate synthetase